MFLLLRIVCFRLRVELNSYSTSEGIDISGLIIQHFKGHLYTEFTGNCQQRNLPHACVRVFTLCCARLIKLTPVPWRACERWKAWQQSSNVSLQLIGRKQRAFLALSYWVFFSVIWRASYLIHANKWIKQWCRKFPLQCSIQFREI